MPKARRPAKQTKAPTLEGVLEALGWAPKTRLARVLESCKSKTRAISDREGNLIGGPACRSISEAARYLGASEAAVRRVLQIARLQGREGLQQARWGGGRP